jgi:hypothetical protein
VGKCDGAKKMIFVVEDLHSARFDAFSVCGPLVELYNEGLANVIYIISDYSAVSRFLFSMSLYKNT